MSTYVVAPKCQVNFKGKNWKAGQGIPGLTRSQQSEHLKSGFMVVKGSPEEAAGRFASPPCTVAPIPIGEDGNEGKEKPIEVKAPQTIIPPKETEISDSKESGSVWVLDPDGLFGKDIEELNVMIAERQPEVDPFDTAEEAITWLSQDYVEPVMPEKAG